MADETGVGAMTLLAIGEPVGPERGLQLDLSEADGIVGPVSKAETGSDSQEVRGGVPQVMTGQSLASQMVEVAQTFLKQRTGTLVSQRLGPLEKLLEHSRTSENGEGMGSQFDYTTFAYVAQNSR
jgi:hypothetical protein